MFLVSSMLVTMWMACVVLGATFGGLAHALAFAAVWIILASGNRADRTRAA